MYRSSLEVFNISMTMKQGKMGRDLRRGSKINLVEGREGVERNQT